MPNACEELRIPFRLRTSPEKSIIPCDDGDELLYRRTHPSIDLGGPVVLSAASLGEVFRPPNHISCNRSRFCERETDVLYNTSGPKHHTTWGVIGTSVGRVRFCEFDYNGRIGTFRVEHTPEPCMYPHSEIFVYLGDERLNKNINSKSLKSLVRFALAPIFDVYHLPDLGFEFPFEMYRESRYQRFRQNLTRWFKKYLFPTLLFQKYKVEAIETAKFERTLARFNRLSDEITA